MVVIAQDESIDIDNVPEEMRVEYGPDMFYQARFIIAKHEYAVAGDDNHKVLLKNEGNTYAHAYCYSGGDYVKTHLPNHTIHASLDMLCEKIDECLKQWNLKYIYVATEDGELLSELHKRQQTKKSGFDMGVNP